MIWLTWRQQRFELLLASVVMVVGGGLLVITRSSLIASFDQLGIPDCLRGAGDQGQCASAYQAFKDIFATQASVLGWVAYVPVLVGVLLAASIALELEQGTYRLAWVQSVTRGKWTLIRLTMPILLGVGISGIIAATSSWMMQSLNQVQGPMRPGAYDIQGVVPVAYMLLAFSATAAVGVTTRRTLPAIGTGTAVAVGLHLVVQIWMRPWFMAPVTRLWSTGPAPYSPQDWLLQGGPGASNYSYVDSVGHVYTLDQAQALCGQVTDGGSKTAWASCLLNHHLSEVVQWQPPERFWAFQGIESGIVVGVSLGLLLLTISWIRARAT